MPDFRSKLAISGPGFFFAALVSTLLLLWIAGGASRADASGQVLVRGGAWLIALVAILFAPRPEFKAMKTTGAILACAVAVVAIQLVPLPPGLWQSLPGREILAEAALATGQPQPWRPISMSPDATANALSSLIVPAVVLVFAANMSAQHHRWTVIVLLTLVSLASFLGLLQVVGSRINHPFVNDVPGQVSAIFANRNHFALFLAIGCLLSAAAAVQSKKRFLWRGLAASGSMLAFALLVLATGSRTGIVVVAAAVLLGHVMMWRQIKEELQQLPRKFSIWIMAAGLLGFVGLLIASIVLGRAEAVERLVSLEAGVDLRIKALPVVLEMVANYFPVGSGFGTFDPVFRISEPDSLLSTHYLNHAHNDFAEVLLDGGILGLALLVWGIAWWARRSVRAWRKNDERNAIFPQLGSAIVLLILLASATDYPARTPIVMGLVALAAVWLDGTDRLPGDPSRRKSAKRD
ncbi:O-antigen ligase family protein [Altererythrobacter sp. Z27]|uniref:O-antigen ligase family protein n=1 Tax=Altererythrobacter sp. Z27 TaxID=3461147 RepID=UPI0040443F91